MKCSQLGCDKQATVLVSAVVNAEQDSRNLFYDTIVGPVLCCGDCQEAVENSVEADAEEITEEFWIMVGKVVSK